MQTSVIIGLLCVMGYISSTHGHGRMIEPPSRASMFRYGFDNPPNYNDNQMFCGGADTQWNKFGGKCGVCGDSFAGPRENEAPTGKYAKGIIVRKYKVGQEMQARIHLTANHKGYFEFRLCVNDDPKKNVTQTCFDEHLLADKSGTTRFQIEARGPEYPAFMLVLPPGVQCAACVLQWKYNAGNSWGEDFVTGQGCIGCGPQEQFYACADVAIGHAEVEVGKPDQPVVVPEGDVDVRTAWIEEEANEAAKQAAKENGTCYCPCLPTSAGNRYNALPISAIAAYILGSVFLHIL